MATGVATDGGFIRTSSGTVARENPYGFTLIENDWCKIRYARTTMIEGYIPPLVVAFTITDDHDVILQWAEVADEAEAP